jgi:hypothetical protein
MKQDDVDEIRMRVTIHWVRGLLKSGVMTLTTVRPHHLWFPVDDLGVYELRQGNAPSNPDRPRHLRGLELWLDPNVPQSVREYVRMGGGMDQLIEDRLETMDRELTSNEVQSIRMLAIANFCKKLAHPKRMVVGG